MFEIAGYPIQLINAIAKVGGEVTFLEMWGDPPRIYPEGGVIKMDYKEPKFAAVRCVFRGKSYRVAPGLGNTPFIEHAADAVAADGRGRFLSQYNSKEVEFEDWLLYCQNQDREVFDHE